MSARNASQAPTTAPACATVPAPELAPSNAPTWPPLSSNRAEGLLWSERLMCLAAPASADVARFAAALGL
jgi:hypothetical protein